VKLSKQLLTVAVQMFYWLHTGDNSENYTILSSYCHSKGESESTYTGSDLHYTALEGRAAQGSKFCPCYLEVTWSLGGLGDLDMQVQLSGALWSL